MKRGVKTFAEALRRKNAKKAKEKFERIAKRLSTKDEYWRGYRRALEGMVAALESGDDLTFLRQLASGRHPVEDIKRYIGEMQAKVDQDFRPKDERGYHAAWVEILGIFLEMTDKSKKK